MFVVAEDFNRQPFNLVGLESLDKGEFDDFVSFHEEENLRKLLGNLFWDAFDSGLNTIDSNGNKAWDLVLYVTGGIYQPTDEVIYFIGNVADVYECTGVDTSTPPTDSTKWTKQTINRWIRLKWGDSFTYNSIPYKWYGFNRLVVPLIYSLWTKFNYDRPGASGVVIQANENSTTISPNERIIRGWNKYAELVGGDGQFMSTSFIFDDWFYANWGAIKNTLFGYLYCNSTAWDDLIPTGFSSFKAFIPTQFKFPGRMNHFDL